MTTLLISVIPPTGSLIVGNTVTYSIILHGVGPFTYTWTANGYTTPTSYSILDTINYSFTLPTQPNALPVSVSFAGPNESFQTYTFDPLPGFPNPVGVNIQPYGMVLSPTGNTVTLRTLWSPSMAAPTYPITSVWTQVQRNPEGITTPHTPVVVQTSTLNSGNDSYTTPTTASGIVYNYSVLMTNVVGSSDINTQALYQSVNVYPQQAPWILVHPVSQSVSEGSYAVFSVVADGWPSMATGPWTYTWRRNGVPIPWPAAINDRFFGTTSLTVANDNGAIYDVVVTNEFGSVTSNTATLTVTPPVVAPDSVSIVGAPRPVTVPSGYSTDFSVVAAGNGTISYQWSKNGSDIPGATSSIYSTPITTLSDNDSQFSVKAVVGSASAVSSSAVLTVTTPPSFLGGLGAGINQPVTYTATASTVGQASDTFMYSWIFDDGTADAGDSLNHTWNTIGNHTASVTAIDVNTGGNATTSKTIKLADWQAMSWVSTGAKIIPSTSSSGWPFKPVPLVISGNLLIDCVDYYTPAGAVSWDTVNMVRHENLTATSALTGGGASCAVMLTAGTNAGKILVISKGGTDYGFLDPVALTMVKSTNVCVALNGSSAFQNFAIPVDSTNILIIGANPANSSIVCQMYNQFTDTFMAKSTINGPAQDQLLSAFLVNNRVWIIRTYYNTTFYYDVAGDTWHAGPAMPGQTFTSGPTLKLASRLGYPFFTSYANPGTAYWWDGVSTTLTSGANFPLSSLNSGTLPNISDSMWETSNDGFIMLMPCYGNGDTVQLSNTVIYSPYSDSFTVVMASPLFGYTRRSAFLNGRFWASGDNGTLYYTDPLW